jgi:hypothetical protein
VHVDSTATNLRMRKTSSADGNADIWKGTLLPSVPVPLCHVSGFPLGLSDGNIDATPPSVEGRQDIPVNAVEESEAMPTATTTVVAAVAGDATFVVVIDDVTTDKDELDGRNKDGEERDEEEEHEEGDIDGDNDDDEDDDDGERECEGESEGEGQSDDKAIASLEDTT